MNDATEYDAWFYREVQAGQEAADAGDVLMADAVEIEANAWRANVRRSIGEGLEPDRSEGRGSQRKK